MSEPRAYLPDPDRMIKYIVNTKYLNITRDREDLVQAGWVGYLRATQLHKAEYGNMSMRYASFWVQAEINAMLKKTKRSWGIEYDEDRGVSNDTGTEDKAQDIEMSDNILVALDKLTPEERDIVTNIYLINNPMGYKEIGELYGVSKQRICQIKDKALVKLRRSLK